MLHPHDDLHERARTVFADLGPHRLITSEMVLAEVFNGLADRGSSIREAVVDLEIQLRDRADITITPQTSNAFRDAAKRYASRSDKDWGLTDCASFLIMEGSGVREALAHDRHFEQAGFLALLR